MEIINIPMIIIDEYENGVNDNDGVDDDDDDDDDDDGNNENS